MMSASQWGRGREREGEADRYSEYPSGCNRHAPQLNRGTWAETILRSAAMLSNDCRHQEEKHSHHGARTPLCTLPDVAVGPRISCNTVCRVAKHIICKHED